MHSGPLIIRQKDIQHISRKPVSQILLMQESTMNLSESIRTTTGLMQ